MDQKYQKTVVACFVGYIVQAIVNNFVPLLFVMFHESFGIPLSKITLLVTINFGVQLCVDIISVTFVDRIGYRASMVLAHATSALGLIALAVMPGILPDPYYGILIAVVLYAIGGGLLEVLVSPVMEACPTPNKETAMSLLHSFYCWGHVGVVLFSTLFFSVFHSTPKGGFVIRRLNFSPGNLSSVKVLPSRIFAGFSSSISISAQQTA